MSRSRLRSVAVTLGAVPLLAATLTACGSDEDYDYSAICVDPNTQVRVDDDNCDDDDRGGGVGVFGWYFLGRGAYAAPIGQRVGGGSFATPSGSHIKGGVPKGGATVQRGGFGGGIKSGGTSGG